MKYSGVYTIIAKDEEDARQGITALFNEGIRPGLVEYYGSCEFITENITPFRTPSRDFPGEYEICFLLNLPDVSFQKGDLEFWTLEYDIGTELFPVTDDCLQQGA